MLNSDALQAVAVEMNRAKIARESGNEGMARVCARRAAGIGLRAFYLQRRESVADPSAYALLNRLERTASTPESIKSICRQLVERVQPDHTLSTNSDLIAQVSSLIAWLNTQIEDN
jgi:hypothetical protein